MIGKQLEEIESTTTQIYARNLDPSGGVNFLGLPFSDHRIGTRINRLRANAWNFLETTGTEP